MSRIAKSPILIPVGIKVEINRSNVSIISSNETMVFKFHKFVNIKKEKNILKFSVRTNTRFSWAQAGTTRAIVNSMIIGLSIGFKKKLILSGVGYRVAVESSRVLNMSLGYSHIVKYVLPKGVYAESNSTNELVLKSSNKQLIGQVAANLKKCRNPEPYKGKGIRYENENIKIKEAKKK